MINACIIQIKSVSLSHTIKDNKLWKRRNYN
uniref:Uncharacterized protein n=1 Tax=Myoviridae sp. ctPuP5 TaxID=2823543 RepID=A0A8S5L9Q4_9CAUD|nr:MAG TPA: hypothetical protein [Myoviridae sp. ctPuP5]